jgi:uncharacterized protein (DUF1800 family)
MITNQQKNQHLLWRAGFGPAADALEHLRDSKPADIYAALKIQSARHPAYIDVVDESLRTLALNMEAAGKQARDENQEARRMLRDKSREAIKSLNITWLYQLIESEAQLREKMSFFWHGHFAARNLNVFFQQQLLDTIRQNALGSFRTLQHQVSKSAAMLNFLNAQQNRKDHPNENFAREVMELFTLGRGNYTENDIKEAARAFTGWGANPRGEFIFRNFFHDDDNKTVFGKSGNYKGEDVLDMLLEQKQTARFITQKIYRFFVNEQVDAKRIDSLADHFYKSDYDIGKLMDEIFTSDWFYEAKNQGSKIKSPIELIAGMQRMLPMKLENEEALLLVQRVLGQQLFYPPNVAGWPGGRSWIDSSTLMMRMRIPMLLNDQDEFNLKPKTDDDVSGGKMEAAPAASRMGGRVINATIDWNRYGKQFQSVPREQLFSSITGYLLQTPLKVSAESVSSFADSNSRDSFLKSATLKVISLPEYQLC